MPQAWSSKFRRQRAKEARRIEHDDEGTTQKEAEQEADAEFATESEQPRGRRVAD